MKKLYLLSQTLYEGLDTFDQILVCAKDEESAKRIAPHGNDISLSYSDTWPNDVKYIKCEEVGNANKDQEIGVILTSFNAG